MKVMAILKIANSVNKDFIKSKAMKYNIRVAAVTMPGAQDFYTTTAKGEEKDVDAFIKEMDNAGVLMRKADKAKLPKGW
jgi:hypothetical protein